MNDSAPVAELMPVTYDAPRARVPATNCTPKQEKFCLHYVEHGNAVDAYRHAYDTEAPAGSTSVRVESWRLLAHPRINARVRALQAVASDRSMVSTDALIADLQDICDADPAELAHLVTANCRYCRGQGNQYQFRDLAEWMHAAAVATEKKRTVPSDVGGYGFNAALEPVAECPRCAGAGVPTVQFTDTSKLSPRARKLFKGLEVKGNGDIKILMHDQLAARQELHRLRGMHVDRSVSVTANLGDVTRATLTPGQAAKLSPDKLLALLWKPQASGDAT